MIDYLNKKNIILLTIIVVLCCLRFIHIEADTPSGISFSAGPYLDEGYKTLSPRNMILFGKEHWHPNDNYPGWMKHSPLTQWAYYLAFKIFGVEIKSARIVTIIIFFMFICGYAFTMKERYDTSLLFAGLILLGIQNILFFFSRIALFELPLILFTYSLLFILIKLENQSYVILLLSAVIFTSFVALTVKLSAVIYIFPIFIGTAIALIVQSELHQKMMFWISLVVSTFMVISFLLFTYDSWSNRIDYNLLSIIRRILFYRPIESSYIVITAGLICTLHGILCQPKKYLGNVYRASLISIILIGPILLSFVSYNPLRYYVPIIPAYILISLEWFYLKTWNHLVPNKLSIFHSLFSFSIAFCIVLYTVYYFIKHILSIVPSDFIKYLIFTIAFLLPIFIWWQRNFFFSKRLIMSTLSVLVILYLSYNSYKVSNFLLYPIYQAKNINAAIERILPSTASIAGDWAPFLALNTKIRTLYMNNKKINNPSKIMSIRPDFFMYCDIEESKFVLKKIIKHKRVSIGSPIYKSHYNERDVIIYPISYF